jgi:hypothetical protein
LPLGKIGAPSLPMNFALLGCLEPLFFTRHLTAFRSRV